MDHPLVELVAQIAHGREADFLERVLGEERRERADEEDEQEHRQDALPLLRRIGVPPAVEASLCARSTTGSVLRRSCVRRSTTRGFGGPPATARARRREHVVEQRLHQRREHGLRQREDDHRAERDERPGLVRRADSRRDGGGRFIRAHHLMISSAARRLAPGLAELARARRPAPRAPAHSRRARRASALPRRCARRSRPSGSAPGTTSCPATMLTRLKCGSFTSRLPSKYVGAAEAVHDHDRRAEDRRLERGGAGGRRARRRRRRRASPRSCGEDRARRCRFVSHDRLELLAVDGRRLDDVRVHVALAPQDRDRVEHRRQQRRALPCAAIPAAARCAARPLARGGFATCASCSISGWPTYVTGTPCLR